MSDTPNTNGSNNVDTAVDNKTSANKNESNVSTNLDNKSVSNNSKASQEVLNNTFVGNNLDSVNVLTDNVRDLNGKTSANSEKKKKEEKSDNKESKSTDNLSLNNDKSEDRRRSTRTPKYRVNSDYVYWLEIPTNKRRKKDAKSEELAVDEEKSDSEKN